MRKYVYALAAIGLALTTTPALAQTASSSAYGVAAGQAVTPAAGGPVTATFLVSPVAEVSGSAPPNYVANDSTANFAAAATLSGTPMAGFGEALSAAAIFTTADGSAVQSHANAFTAFFNLGLGSNVGGIDVTLLSLSAMSILSDSQANSVGGLDASGFTVIENLALTGTALGGAMIDGALFAAPAPNTVLFSGGGLSIILNEQTMLGDGVTSLGIATNAIAFHFVNFALGADVKNGDVIIGHSEAFATLGRVGAVVPEPSVWAMLLLGFGATGACLRRRRGSAFAR